MQYRSVFVCVLALALAGAAHARAVSSLEVQSNTPATVYVDGQLKGKAPLTVQGIQPGFHRVRVVDDLSGRVRLVAFVAPQDKPLSKLVDVSFSPAPPPAPAVVAPAPVVLAPRYRPAYPYYSAYAPFRPFYGSYFPRRRSGFGLGFGFGRGFGYGRGFGRRFGGFRGGFRGRRC